MKPGLPRRRTVTAAFTLVEVVLAIGIAIGLLVVALYFYQQAAHLRAQLLEESDRLATVRLLLDRITTDLRTAYAQPQTGFAGGSASMSFVRTDALSRPAWITDLGNSPASLETDLKLVRYDVTTALEGTNLVVRGLTRVEQPLETARPLPDAPAGGTGPADLSVQSKLVLEPLTDALRFVHLRYWDGASWQEKWDSSQLPKGVAVTLGVEPLPEGVEAADYPSEMFRRVIALPSHRGMDDDVEFFGALEERPANFVRFP